MKTIYKYPFKVDDTVAVTLPKGANIVYVDTQRDRPFFWAEVDTDQPDEERTLYIRGTGNPFTGDESRYIGTFYQGPFVWHVYE